MSRKIINVVGAAIIKDGEVLCARRGEGKSLAGVSRRQNRTSRKRFVAPMMSLDYFPERVKSMIVNMCLPLCKPCLVRKFLHNSAKMISIIF